MDSEMFGRSIRQRRKDLGLRQQELASLANVGTRFLSDLENGKSSIEFGLALRIANLLGLKLAIERRSWPTVNPHDL